MPENLLSKIELKDGSFTKGFYLHRMMVFTFGDRNGSRYNKDLKIDHVNMIHSDASVQNLEVVNNVVNLSRAVVNTDFDISCVERLENYLDTLTPFARHMAEILVEEDLKRRFR